MYRVIRCNHNYLSMATATRVLTEALTATACKYGMALHRKGPKCHSEIQRNNMFSFPHHAFITRGSTLGYKLQRFIVGSESITSTWHKRVANIQVEIAVIS